MITGISIENFKGIGDQGIHLDLKPVTMLFGANSAGKTTILHAILLASEVLLNRNCNPDRTSSGGESVDLGGFRTFVHKHDVNNDIKLGFDVAFKDEAFEEEYFIEPLFVDLSTGRPEKQGLEDCFDVSDVGGQIRTGTVELLVRWDSKTQMPYVRSYEVTLDGHFLGDLVYDPQSDNLCIQDLNLSHPALLCHDAPLMSNISIGIADLLCPELRNPLQESFYPVSGSLIDWLESPIRQYELDTDNPGSHLILRSPDCDPNSAVEFSVRRCEDARFEGLPEQLGDNPTEAAVLWRPSDMDSHRLQEPGTDRNFVRLIGPSLTCLTRDGPLLRRCDKPTDGCCHPPTMMRPDGKQAEEVCQRSSRLRCARVATVPRTINAQGLADSISRSRLECYRAASMRE